MEAVLGPVRGGSLRVVSVEGAAGMGKSALVRRFLASIDEVVILQALAGQDNGRQHCPVVDQLVAAARPWVSEQVDEELPSPVAGPAEAVDRLIDLVGGLQVYGPVLMVVDQLDLADASSADALLLTCV